MNRIFQADDDHKPSIERTYLDFAKILLAKANDLLEARGPVGLSGETSVRVRKLAREFLRGALTYLPHQAESAFLYMKICPENRGGRRRLTMLKNSPIRMPWTHGNWRCFPGSSSITNSTKCWRCPLAGTIRMR